MIEEFFDLRIATVRADEEPPEDADWVRIEEPSAREVAARRKRGWFYKPCFVTYVIQTPPSVDEYIRAQFRAGTRNKPRRLLRDVPKRYALVTDGEGRHLEAFRELYRRTIVGRPRGKDRLAEHGPELEPRWLGLHLFEGKTMAAGVLVHVQAGHLSVAYGGFDPAHRGLDLEHYLIMKAMELAIEAKCDLLSLGMDTNRYGHHLPLGLPAYKLRLGFVPLPYEPCGRELVKVQRFAPFEEGLFFYSYGEEGLMGEYFTREEPNLRPFRHHNAPPVRVHRI